MKKVTLLVICLFTLAVFCCACNHNQTVSETNDDIYNAEISVTETFDIYDDIAIKYSLTNTDIQIVNRIFEQKDKFETIQNSITEKYSRKPLSIHSLVLCYDGTENCLICLYQTRSTESSLGGTYEYAYIYFDLDTEGNLTLKDYDTKHIFNEPAAQGGCGFTVEMTDDEKYEKLAEMFSQYKVSRQTYFGDVNTIENTFDTLSDGQRLMYDNIFKNRETWEVTEKEKEEKNKCVSIKIWSFGDGSAEILCSYGTARYDSETLDLKSSVSVRREGYAVDNNGITILDSDATHRLENDVNDQKECAWNYLWNEDTKSAKLSTYIGTYFAEL